MKKIVMVEAISQFRVRYAVEVEELEYALDEMVMREQDPNFKEFSQEHLGVTIFDHYELNKEQYLEMFDKDNGYLSHLTDEQKLSYINQTKED